MCRILKNKFTQKNANYPSKKFKEKMLKYFSRFNRKLLIKK